MANKIIPYRRDLKSRAQKLRRNQTDTEEELWQRIRKKSLGVEFHRQVPMLDYIVDFYCHEIGLVIEVDGNSHDYKYEYDAKRQGRLEKEGVAFIRFTDIEVKKDMFSVLLALEHKIDELLNG